MLQLQEKGRSNEDIPALLSNIQGAISMSSDLNDWFKIIHSVCFEHEIKFECLKYCG